ncbi:MAG TPA: hypothetical protein VGR87_05165 [Candidatus Limnocylindria bacterium]|jgi:hypothetical protein|nr:hypothetical protein [Candidatus Limnocylindria bacterium]
MRVRTLFATLAILTLTAGVVYAASFQVRPGEFDPARTFLVQAEWLSGIGCPTNAKISTNGSTTTGTYTDPACATGDSSDSRNQGLLLAKTGPTPNVASAFAELRGVRGMRLTEIGFDIRKPGSAADPRGSHCGAGAPRFNVTAADGITYDFIGCNSSATPTNPAMSVVGTHWLRLRWGGGTILAFAANGPQAGTIVNISGIEVSRISILFDEGQDTGPDNFGLAVLDNIDVNGTLVGHGPNEKREHGKNKDKDKDKHDDDNDDQGDDD